MTFLSCEHREIKGQMDAHIKTEFDRLDSLVLYQFEYGNRFSPDELVICDSLLTILKKKSDHPQIGALSFLTKGMLQSKSYYSLQAFELYQSGLEVSRMHGLKKYEALFEEKLAEIHNFSGNKNRSIEGYKRAHTLWKELGDTSKMGHVLNFTGIVLAQHGDYNKSIEYHQNARLIFKKLKDTEGLLVTLNCLGMCKEQKGDFKSALEYHSLAQEIALSQNDIQLQLIPQFNMAKLNAIEGNNRLASQLYQDILLTLGNNKSLLRISTNQELGVLFSLKLQQPERALDCFNEALRLSKEFGAHRDTERTLRLLYEHELAGGHFKDALTYLSEYGIVRDSIIGQSHKTEIVKAQALIDHKRAEQALAEAEVNLIAEKTDKSLILTGSIGLFLLLVVSFLAYYRNRKLNKLLVFQKEALLDQQVRISQSLEEREILIKEIHHRVKNNLQVISSLMYLRSNENNDPKTQRLIDDGQGRIKSMALIHQKLYECENLVDVSFGEYLRELVTEIKVSFGELASDVVVEFDTEEVFLDIDSAIPLGLIVNELVTNAFKYAYEAEKPKHLLVELKRSNAKLEMRISDNGKGFDFQAADNSKSLGLRLVKLLSKQVEGTTRFDFNQGTTFSIIFNARIK